MDKKEDELIKGEETDNSIVSKEMAENVKDEQREVKSKKLRFKHADEIYE